MKKLTKEEVIKCFEICSGSGLSCRGCPLEGETLTEPCKTIVDHNALQYLRCSDNAVDIPKIIDEAMEKKDRSVTIFIGAQGTTVNVYPYQETEARWQPIGYQGQEVRCSECGYVSRWEAPYCSKCGERLKPASHIDKPCYKCLYAHDCDMCETCIDKCNFKEKPEVTENEPETTVE